MTVANGRPTTPTTLPSPHPMPGPPAGRRARRRVLVQLNSARIGGCQINAIDLASKVRDHGWDAELVVFSSEIPTGPSTLPLIRERGLRLHVLPRHTMFWQAAPTIARLARAMDASVVHSYGSLAARPAYWGPCALGRIPLVQTVYEMQMAPGEKRHTSMIVGTGYLLEELRGRPGPVSLVSPPVDVLRDRPEVGRGIAFREQRGLPGDQVLLVIVSRLDRDMKARSIELAMEAMRARGLSQVTLVVVGGGDAEATLAARAEQVNRALGRRAIVLTGPVEDPRPAYSTADIVLGMGSSAARALAFGKPVVVTGENGWCELFNESTAAGLFRNSFWSDECPADPVARLVGVLVPLARDQERRLQLGRQGREFAVENFSLAAMSERLAAVYERAVTDSGPRQWLADLPAEVRRTARGLGARARMIPSGLT